MFEHVQRMRRSARVVRTGGRIYLRYKRVQRKVRGRPQEERDEAWIATHERSAEEIYQLAVSLKGLFIKVGQFAGTRSDLAPEPYVRSLSRLQDAVPPRPVKIIRRIIEEDLGSVESLFAHFDDQPLAAASLAQVHRATLADGTPVAVKVQYPEVGDLVRLDLRNLRTLARLVAWREPGFDYRAIVDELGRQIPLEVDFVREAEMSRRIAENLREIPGIVVPDVINGMVSRRVLVTHFYDGERVVGNRSAGLEAAERESLATRIAGAFGHQIMIDGLFQADPHPGNLLLMPNGDVTLLDFGLTKELPDEIRIGFARLVIAAAARDPHAVMQAFKGLGIRTGTDNPQDLVALTNLFFDARPIDGGQRQFQEQRSRAMARSPVEAIPGDLVLLGRVVGLLRGVCASLGVALSPMQMLQPYAVRALEEAEGMKEGAGTAP
jgi:predicted unusual protein kinase regulating ubiquinone biosynthesis (AarF/ABC1/UbiB family)